jgi:serine protease
MRLFLLVAGFVLAATADGWGQNLERGVVRLPTTEIERARPVSVVARVERRMIADVIAGARISPQQRLALEPKYLIEKPRRVDTHAGLDRSRVIVKFVDGARVRAVNRADLNEASEDAAVLRQRLRTLGPQLGALDQADLAFLREHGLDEEALRREMAEFRQLAQEAPLRRWGRLYRNDPAVLEGLRANAERVSGRRAADLANYYWFELSRGNDAADLANSFNQLAVIEEAYLAPIPETPQAGIGTPDFSGEQGYLNSAPRGIDARFGWTVPGGRGARVDLSDRVRVVDIEAGWNLQHEDLPSMFLVDGRIDGGDSRQHGTAVMSVMLGVDNGIGVTGIVPDARGGVVSVRRNLGIHYYYNVGEAIVVATMAMAEGDVVVIEQHARGPGRDNDCTACIRNFGDPREQCGYIAMEFWNHVFDAVNAASLAGLIVVEAAGNGEMDLDHQRYRSRFNRTQRNSGAIMVGAGSSSDRSPLCFTNHGSRVDLQGWGQSVMAAGYGEALGSCNVSDPSCIGVDDVRVAGDDENRWYRSTFSGTSSAAPIVAGAVIAVQGVQMENNNPVLGWSAMRELLRSTGTPQSGTDEIGPLPNLRAALGQLVQDSPPSLPNAVYETTVSFGEDVITSAQVAGLSGDQRMVLGQQNPRQGGLLPDRDRGLRAVKKLSFAERGDRPCFLEIERADILGNVSSTSKSRIDLCGDGGPTSRSMRSIPRESHLADSFLRGVAVCNSRSNSRPGRLKGIRTFHATVEADGRIIEIANPATEQRTNCNGNWREVAFCPTGTLATAIEVHLRPDGNDQSVSGLALRCREVQVERECVANCGG